MCTGAQHLVTSSWFYGFWALALAVFLLLALLAQVQDCTNGTGGGLPVIQTLVFVSAKSMSIGAGHRAFKKWEIILNHCSYNCTSCTSYFCGRTTLNIEYLDKWIVLARCSLWFMLCPFVLCHICSNDLCLRYITDMCLKHSSNIGGVGVVWACVLS